MPARVVMPKLGLSMKTGTISAWRVEDGGPVKAGQILFVVETEKVNVEIEAASTGLVKHAEPAGATVAPGHLIGYILAAGEDVPDIAPSAGAAARQNGHPTTASAPAAAPARSSGQPGAPGRRISATPVARKIAAQLGVDLSAVTGTGPGGRIVKEDVEAAAGGMSGLAAGPEPGTAASGDDLPERRPLSQMRQAIARRMTTSLHESAQLTIGTEVDITDLVSLTGAMSDDTEQEPSPTITDVLVLAVARALRRHPGINVSLDGEQILQHAAVHLGFAVALTDGLVVPVLRSVHRMSLGEIMSARRALAEAARGGKLTLDDMTGSTFTITSLGQNQVTWFTPILNPPEAAILGVGRATERVAWRDGAAEPRTVLPLSLTIDHRLIDGAPAAAFLDELANSLRKPLRLLM